MSEENVRAETAKVSEPSGPATTVAERSAESISDISPK
jgi:hypothetical protein